jgi:hypothetical protein
MECQRCLTGKEAKYRVYTDVIDTQSSVRSALMKPGNLELPLKCLIAAKQKITTRRWKRTLRPVRIRIQCGPVCNLLILVISVRIHCDNA